MATRAERVIDPALIRSATVKSGEVVTLGKPIKLSSGEVLDCTAGESADGIALEAGAAGAVVSYAVVGCGGIVPVLVGTGGATEGAFAVVVSDGVTDSATLGDGTTPVKVVGKFRQTGSAGDIVGMIPLAFIGST
jgi:hypothetical protein